MNLTLIYPGNDVNSFGTFGKSDGENNFVPHGLGNIAAYITKYGYKVNFIDIRKLKNWEDFKEKIKDNPSLVYGITSTTVDFEYAIKCAEIIKESKKNSKIMIGGVHPSVRPEDALKIEFFDYVVVGEGEIATLEILESIKKGHKIDRLIKGKQCNLDDIPIIDRDLFNHRDGEMVNPFIKDLKTPSATIITGRGCPYNCRFCQPAEREVFGGKVRLRKIEDVVDELVEIKEKYGLKSFLIHDDLFIISKRRMNEFIKLYKEKGIDAEFYCQGRADLIIKYQDQIKKLADIGLKGIMIGFESGSDRVLEFIDKGATVEQNKEAARICKKLGIKIWANFMFGLPGESYIEMIKTAKMISEISPDYNSPSLFTPYPRTYLYDFCEENDLLAINDFKGYRRNISKERKIKGVNYGFIRLLIFLILIIQKIIKITGSLTFSKKSYKGI